MEVLCILIGWPASCPRTLERAREDPSPKALRLPLEETTTTLLNSYSFMPPMG